MKWHMRAVNLTNNVKVKIDFTLPEFSATEIVTWEFHMDDSDKDRYSIIIGRYILISLLLNINFSKRVIEAGGGPLKGYTSPMIYLGEYKFKYLNTVKIRLRNYLLIHA